MCAIVSSRFRPNGGVQMQMFCIHNISYYALLCSIIILYQIFMHKSNRCRVDFFSLRNSNGGYKTQFRHMSLLAPMHIWFIMFFLFSSRNSPLGKKRKGRPLAAVRTAHVGIGTHHSLLTIFHPGEMPTRRRDGFVDREG